MFVISIPNGFPNLLLEFRIINCTQSEKSPDGVPGPNYRFTLIKPARSSMWHRNEMIVDLNVNDGYLAPNEV
jgi:hypothetical protein